MRTSIFIAAAAGALALSPANAASVINPNGSVTLEKGDDFAFSILYNGIIEGDEIDGLSAQVDFAFVGTSPDAKTYNFTYQIHNMSGGDITASRVSMFGANIDPNILSAVSTGIFPKDSDGNAPQIGTVDVCFHNRNGNGNNCAGGSGAGVGIGQSSPDNPLGTFALTFGTVPVDNRITLDGFFVRYQSIYGVGIAPGDSGVGAGTPLIPTVPIPEPATWAMMIGGFGLAGGALRIRRRGSRATA